MAASAVFKESRFFSRQVALRDYIRWNDVITVHLNDYVTIIVHMTFTTAKHLQCVTKGRILLLIKI